MIDAGDPEQNGFKSFDWWGPIRAYSQGWSPEHTDNTFSAICWDRWKFKGLYVTGGDGGLFFDCTDKVQPFSIVVEDCVSIGRAFGIGVANCLARPEEPITFRKCYACALDWWGDTSAAYLRCENDTMPTQPDVIIEDCTLLSPQCAVKVSNYGYFSYTRVKMKGCQAIVTNFSQPVGTPSDGIIQSMEDGRLLYAEIENSVLMGYKVFGVKINPDTAKDIQYSIKGDVRAYVQYQQDIPDGITRLGGWPTNIFDSIAPPKLEKKTIFSKKELIKPNLCEVSPFIWNDRLCMLESIRPGNGSSLEKYYLSLKDVQSGEEIGRCGSGYGLPCAIVDNGTLYLFASRWTAEGWKDVTVFYSFDLKHWDSKIVIEGDNEGIFNTSVCKDQDGFIIAYESNHPDYPAFTTKFAHSQNLLNWTKLPNATFGTDRYTACPCIRYVNGFYYVLYLEHRKPRWFFETYITRSKDLINWELSSANPVISPESVGEGINASDPELIEWNNKTYLYYAVGDQLAWMDVKRAIFPGKLADFLVSFYNAPGIPDSGTIGRLA